MEALFVEIHKEEAEHPREDETVIADESHE